MMKAKNPGAIWEYTARAVRSEGPVITALFSSEDHSSSSPSAPSTPISGTPAKKTKKKHLPATKRKDLPTKKTIRKPTMSYGSTGSECHPDPTDPSTTS